MERRFQPTPLSVLTLVATGARTHFPRSNSQHLSKWSLGCPDTVATNRRIAVNLQVAGSINRFLHTVNSRCTLHCGIYILPKLV
jgi:hypothetical protein